MSVVAEKTRSKRKVRPAGRITSLRGGLTAWLSRPLADFPIEAAPGARVYDAGDMNFAPLRGAGTLLRPGPRLRVWWVRPAAPIADGSPFLPGRAPPMD